MEARYAEARLQFQQSYFEPPLQLAEAGYKDSSAYPDLNWQFRILLAEARVRNGQANQALEPLQPEPPASLPQEISFHRRLAQALTLCWLQNYDQAKERLDQAEALSENQNERIAQINFIRGRCEISRSEWTKAEGYFQLVIAPGASSDSFLKANTFNNLGWAVSRTLRYEKAIDWYAQCLDLARSLHAPPLEEKALSNLGDIYVALRDFPNAIKYSTEAEHLASQLKMFHDQLTPLIDIGFMQQAQGQLGAAENSYLEALKIAKKIGDADRTSICLHNLTALKLIEHQTDLAEQYFRENSALSLKGDRLTDHQLDQAGINTAHAQYATARVELLQLLQQLEDETRSGARIPYRLKWTILQRLARNSIAQGDPAQAEQWFLKGIATVEEAISQTKSESFKTTMRDNLPIFDEYVAFLIDQKRYDKAFQFAQIGRGRSLLPDADSQRYAENTKAWLAKVQGYLHHENAVLLSYFASEKQSYLWAITGNHLKLFPLNITGPDIDNLIDSYQQEIQQHLPIDASPAAKKLFQALVQPANDLLPKGAHVIIVADSKIYTVNFESLISSQGADHYWIEDVDIQNASSVDLLITPGKRRSPAKGLLLIGAPEQADPHYVELPHAREEMESVRKHFSPAAVASFSGRDATPDSYKNSSPGSYKFIYFATHGTANTIDPMQSAIILYGDNGKPFKLLASDIISDKLHLNADLVTISACEGAGGQVQSLEGLLGLEWAFMRAGAHQVVAALWDVNDEMTPGLMDNFYGQLQQGKSAADALRYAKLALLHAGGAKAAPYYWATLQLYTRS